MVDSLGDLLNLQSGVITRQQLHACGWARSDIERALRRRELVRLLPGVFVNHTGEATWLQRAWAGTLYYGPAALSGESALRAENGPGGRFGSHWEPIRIGVDHGRRVKSLPGYVVERFVDLPSRVRWNLSPPRMRLEEAVLDVAARAPTDLAAFEALAAACRARRTTPGRLLDSLAKRTRVSRRVWLEASLRDLSSGTCSVLESGYLRNVERAHGLPRGNRQSIARVRSGIVYRDVEYEPFGLIVELDGLLFHDGPAQRNRDLARDLEAAVADQRTLRLGWAQTFESPCRTAFQIARILQGLGWQGSAGSCGVSCQAPHSRAG